MIRATILAASLAALILALSSLADAARDAREAIHDGQTPARLCGDICREADPDDGYLPAVVDPAEACEPGEPAILGNDC